MQTIIPQRDQGHEESQTSSLRLLSFAPLRDALLFVLLLLTTSQVTATQTIYTVVLGNQDYVVGSSTLRSGLFVSYDSAKSWKHLGPENLKAYSMDAVDSSNGQILFIAAGNGVHRSTDYGKSWKIVTDWRMTEVMDVKVDQLDPSNVYAGTAFGFWRSTDGGETWENPEGEFHDTYLYRLEWSHFKDELRVLRLFTDYARQYPDGTSTVSSQPDSLLRIGLFRDSLVLKNLFDSLFFNPLLCDWKDAFATARYDFDLDKHSNLIFSDLQGLWLDTTRTFSLNSCDEEFISFSSPSSQPTHALAPLFGRRTLLAGTFGDGLYKWDGTEWEFAGLPGSQVWRIVVKQYSVPEEVGHVH